MAKKVTNKTKTIEAAAVELMEQPGGEFKEIALAEIDSSPLNYRRLFPLPQLQELATSIALHGVIENLTVRRMSSGRYEVVAGERRYRAAGMARLTIVPCMIRQYTDEQVRQIQLAENLHRLDPTPLEEAEGLRALLELYDSIEIVASKVGKSKTYIYSRLKLLSLIPAVQEMLIAGKFTLQEAVLIASLAPASQEQFFADYCEDWTADNWERPDLDEALDRFTYELNKAPFSLSDEKLYPEMGACNTCPFNTATASLFPELAAKAVCTNNKCFDHKTDIQFLNGLRGIIKQKLPDALLFSGKPSPYLRRMIEQVPELKDVLTYSTYEVDTVRPPDPPIEEDYRVGAINDDGEFDEDDEYEEYDNDDEGRELDDEEESYEEDNEKDDPPIQSGEPAELDRVGYAQAVDEYNIAKAQFEQSLTNKEVLEGLFLSERKFEYRYFNPDPHWRKVLTQGRKELPTAKDVQAAIKAGTATVELLTGEIERIETRASRNLQLDREKVQQTIYKKVTDKLEPDGPAIPITEKDWPAVWLLIYKSLDYNSQATVDERLWPEMEEAEKEEGAEDSLYARLQQLTPAQIGWFVRKAVTSKSESKSATSEIGYFLYQMAGSLSIDTEAIELAQQEKAETRQERNEARIRDLNKRIKRLQAREQRLKEQQQEQQQQ